MNELVFNGRNMTEFGAYVLSSNFLEGAEKDIEAVSVLGKNGDLLIDNKRFKNKNLWVALYIDERVYDNLDAMRNFLLSCNGYCRYEETKSPNQFRIARYIGEFKPLRYADTLATILLEFDAKPQRFMKSGEIPIQITESTSLYNPTYFDALPLIRVYGTGSFGIGNISVEVLEHNEEYIDIDCELYEADISGINMSQYIESTNHEYPVLKSGENGITVDGVTLEITPRWYTI